MRRDVSLPDADVKALDELGLPWETVNAAGCQWLYIHQYPLPAGYTVSHVTLAVRLAAYPEGILDMVYVHPAIGRSDGLPINNLSALPIDGQIFQQWSRHYPWTSEDNLLRHIRRAGAWFNREFQKR